MPEPEIVRLARAQRADLLAHDAATLRELTRRWLAVERGLQGAQARLLAQVDALRARGETISRSRLYRLARYGELLAAAQVEIGQYTAWAAGQIAGAQATAAAQGVVDAQALTGTARRAAGEDAAGFASFGQLAPDAVNVMIGYASDQAPLHRLLAAAAPAAIEGLTQALVDGVAQGLNPRETARRMADGLGLGLPRALLTARDQTLRAYRTAADQQYAANGDILAGKRRLAAHQSRTCLACLARDGEIIPLDQPMYDHPQGRCTCVPILRDGRLNAAAYGGGFVAGEQWFRAQPAAVQRQMMGDGRYEAWLAGKCRFRDLAADTEHAVWGRGLRVRSAQELEALAGDWAPTRDRGAHQGHPNGGGAGRRFAGPGITPPAPAGLTDFGQQVQALTDPQQVLRIGEAPDVIAALWRPVASTVVLTGERRQHYLARHPDVAAYEAELAQVIRAPDEVHRNKKDRQIAILYRDLDDKFCLRVALWLSNREGWLNSVHSYRLARRSEVVEGRQAGRAVWRKK